MKKIWLFSVVLSGVLLGSDFGFSLSSTATLLGASSTNQQVSSNNGYKIRFDSNGYVVNNTLPWLRGNNSPFDAFDFDPQGFLRRTISTKIVNKKFWLILAPNPTNSIPVKLSSKGFDVYVSVYDMHTKKVISNTLHFAASTSFVSFPKLFKGFTVTQASKNARVGFLTCSYYGKESVGGSGAGTVSTNGKEVGGTGSGSVSGDVYIIYPHNDCSADKTIHKCNWKGKGYRICYSSDNFAIRPDKFIITNIPKEKIKAGKEFNLTIKALDYKGNPTKDYNETLTLKGNSSPSLEYNDTNFSKGCITGILNGKNLQFKNGEVNVTLNYSEAGELNITIKEINGSEFAKVDKNDDTNSQLFIIPASIQLKFIPDHFNIFANYYNFNHSQFTYISNDLNMSSILDINITAQNEQNKTTKNYNSKCYAKDSDLNISYGSVPSKLTKILVKENNNETNITIPNTINLKFTKDIFTTDHNGSADLNLKINFKRNPRVLINEFNFTVKDINVSDKDDVMGSDALDKNATFRYGRIDVQNIGGYSKELNTTYKYEYWTNDGWIVNKEHNSSIFGDVNESKSYHPFVTMDVNHTIKSGKENISLSTTHAIPYSTKIHLAIPSWLWYNPLAESYKNPSATNQNCLTHPCESVTFNKISIGWGGIGKDNVKSSETNRTAEINASLKKVKANKSEVKKLNW